jgi:hypothetical protein
VTSWTTPADVQRRLRRRWDTGELLRWWMTSRPWEPLDFALRAPTSADIAADLGAVKKWVTAWERATPPVRLERRRVGGRLVGVNEVPARAWIDGYDQAWALLEIASQVAQFDHLLTATKRRAPRLVDWISAYPLRLLDVAADWDRIIDTVLWIDNHCDRQLYLRQVDVPGVDTKFIEGRRPLLSDLLDLQLEPKRIGQTTPRTAFEARYGFRRRPLYLRLRSLDPELPLADGFSELTVRQDELIDRPPEHLEIFIIENEVTYLAFPEVTNAVAIFGGGYAVASIESSDWLADRRVTYWGDIDTHGFAILNRLRQRVPHALSLLMDRATLLSHESQWVREPNPTNARLDHLLPQEAELYRDLVEDSFGGSVRLEQERVSFAAISRALSRSHRPA